MDARLLNSGSRLPATHALDCAALRAEHYPTRVQAWTRYWPEPLSHEQCTALQRQRDVLEHVAALAPTHPSYCVPTKAA